MGDYPFCLSLSKNNSFTSNHTVTCKHIKLYNIKKMNLPLKREIKFGEVATRELKPLRSFVADQTSLIMKILGKNILRMNALVSENNYSMVSFHILIVLASFYRISLKV